MEEQSYGSKPYSLMITQYYVEYKLVEDNQISKHGRIKTYQVIQNVSRRIK